MVIRARRAQSAFENWTDQRIDALRSDVATMLAGRAEQLVGQSAAYTNGPRTGYIVACF